MALKIEQILRKHKESVSPEVRKLVKASVTKKRRKDKSFLKDENGSIPKYKGWAV